VERHPLGESNPKLESRKDEETSMISSCFSHELVPTSVRRATFPLFLVIRFVLLAIPFLALPGQLSAGGGWCTAPYVQVAGQGVGVDQTGEFIIQSVSMGEPFDGDCSHRSLKAVIKVNTLDPGNTGQVTPPYDTEWEVEFHRTQALIR
jgi:hypothetical protein